MTIIFVGEQADVVIDYVNHEYVLDLIDIASVYADDYPEQQSVQIVNIASHGFLLDWGVNKCTWILFDQPIEQIDGFYDAYFRVLSRAKNMLGKPIISSKERQFLVVDSRPIGDVFWRMTLSSDLIACWQAGLSYLFVVSDTPMQYRYYTVRQVRFDGGRQLADVDVFLHGDGLGGRWAMDRRVGDVVKSKRDFPEELSQLTTGRVLFLVDESSLSTLLALLEHWANPVLPVVIVLWQGKISELDDYVHQSAKSDQSLWRQCQKCVISICYPLDEQTVQAIMTQVSDFLATLSQDGTVIDRVWGATEINLVKKLRQLIMQTLNLSKSHAVIKGYWRDES